MKKIIALIVLMLVIAGGVGWYYTSDSYREKQFMNELATTDAKTRTQMQELVDRAKSWEDKIESTTTTLAYAEAARWWKTIGDSTVQTLEHHDYARQRAADLYEDALQKFGENALLYTSAADTYSSLGKFDTADEYYQRALALEPGNPGLYQKLANLYRYSMKKSSDEVLAVYNRALQRLVEGTPDILKDRATYYESIGKLKEAATDWAKVVVLEPANEAAKQEYSRIVQTLRDQGIDIEATASTTPSGEPPR